MALIGHIDRDLAVAVECDSGDLDQSGLWSRDFTHRRQRNLTFCAGGNCGVFNDGALEWILTLQTCKPNVARAIKHKANPLDTEIIAACVEVGSPRHVPVATSRPHANGIEIGARRIQATTLVGGYVRIDAAKLAFPGLLSADLENGGTFPLALTAKPRRNS